MTYHPRIINLTFKKDEEKEAKMLSIILYGISILFSPGPVTLIAVNKGIHKELKTSWGYFISIGIATYALLLIYGYTGNQFIKKDYLPIIGILGFIFMIYLSLQMFKKPTPKNFSIKTMPTHRSMGFKEGLALQFFNPKASLAALPIALVQYPGVDISGIKIALVSLIFLGFGILSPLLYCLLGQFASSFIKSTRWLGLFNKGMALLLAFVAVTILIDII